MGTKTTPGTTIWEFGRFKDYLRAAVGRGDREFRTVELANECDLTVPEVNESMLHLSSKHEHVTDIRGGG